jgi:parallel beta-helix repeat protein
MKKIKIFLIFCLFISIPAFSRAQNFDEFLRMQIPGRIEGRGTYFEIKDSDYLNITLESEKEIEVFLESIPRMISLNIASSTEATTTLILKGLGPNKKYFKYEDSHKNEIEFFADQSESYSWQQDLTNPHHIWIQEIKGTIYLSGPEGCTSTIGIWDESSRTCTLIQDVTTSVEIATSNITLDCNENNHYSITGNGTDYGVLITGKENVTIKNCKISNFSTGIYLYNSTNIHLIKNDVFYNTNGISLSSSMQSELENNKVTHNKYSGIFLYFSSQNKLKNNFVADNNSGIYLQYSEENLLRGNRMENNEYNFGIYVWLGIYDFQILGEINDIDDSNTVDGKPIYYWVDRHDLTTPTNGGSVILVNCSNITVKGLEIKNNFHGILLINTSSSTITENNLENNFNALVLSFDSNNNQIIANKINKNFFGLEIHKSSDNLVRKNKITNNGSFVFGGYGIFLYVSSKNVLVENDILSNNINEFTIGLLLLYSDSNRIYHNNFINNSRQISSDGWPNSFDNGYPSGGNYWSDYKGSDADGDGIGDTPYCFYGGCDRYPFMRENGWEIVINQSPMVSNLGEFKSDGITPIIEGGITTESSPDNPYNSLVVFKAVLSDPDNDDVKLEVELKEYNQSFDGQNIIQSDFISSGNIATITRYGLIEGKYKWRARAIDSRGAVSEWQEFGEIGNVDFEVKLMPLYTQIESPYPSLNETRLWYRELYANANPEKDIRYSCGYYIYQCGCAITSQVMILRFHGVTTTVDGKDINPGTFNEWLKNNNGYWPDGGVKWAKIQDYSRDEYGFARVIYEGPINFKDNFTLDLYLDNLKPVILKVQPVIQGEPISHFIVADGKLANTYTIKDPAWYNTRKLTQPAGSYVYNYNNSFYGLRLFSPAFALKGVDSISLNLASPAELLITDPKGRRLGKDPINNVEYNEIPGGSYYQEGIGNPFAETPNPDKESKFIWIPKPMDGQYLIQVIGTEEGSYTMELLAYGKNGESKDVIHKGSIAPNIIQKFELNYSKENIQEAKFYRIVDIDIKPGSDPNSINLKSKGLIPVAVLADEFFDPKDIVIDSITFAGANPLRGNFEDVDNDGDLDLILHFNTQSLNLTSSDTKATLFGRLNNGTLIKGVDSIRVVGK